MASAAPRSGAAVAYAIVFIAFVDTFAMLPTVAPYADRLGSGVLGVGIAVGAYSVTNLLFNVVGGALLDRFGRRRLLIAGLAVAGASMLAYVSADSPGALVAARLLHGVGGGILLPAVFTVVGDLSPGGARGRVMGRAGAVIGAAAVAAPGLAGVLRQVGGFTAVFGAIATAMAAGVVLVLIALPEPGERDARTQRAGGWREILDRPALRAAFGGAFALTFSVGTLAAFLPLHVEALGFAAGATGGLFTGFAAVAGVVMLSRLAAMVDRRGVVAPTATGLCVLAVALGTLGLAPPMSPTLGASLLFGVGYGLVFPATAGMVAAATAPAERGRAYGLYNVFFSLGLAVGPAAGGAVAATGMPPFTPAVAACLIGAVALLLSRRAAGVAPIAG